MKRIELLAVAALLLLLPFGAGRGVAQSFKPENIGPRVNSAQSDVNPVFSKGGDTLFFSRITKAKNSHREEDTQDIWMSVKDKNGKWGEAVRLPNSVNIGRYNALYAALDDGSYLIAGIFDKHGKKWLRNGFSLIRPQGDSSWSAPQRLNLSGFTTGVRGDFVNASMTPDGKYLFLAYSKCWKGKRLKLYVSEQKKPGKYSKPKKLKGDMRKFYTAETPVFSVADSVLYFSGVSAKGNGHKMYRAVPVTAENSSKKVKPMREWTDVKELSDTVHLGSWNSYFTPSRSGAYAALCSTGDGAPSDSSAVAADSTQQSERSVASIREEMKSGSVGRSDIFVAMLVETRPWVLVHGRLVDARTNELLPAGKDVKILVNGEVSDSVALEGGNRFTALLPLNARYEFTSQVTNFISDTAVVDVTGRRLYKEDTVTLTLRTLPYVLVSGQLLDSYSMQPIDRKYTPKVLVDGKTVDSLKVNAAKSTYEVTLPYGKKYSFSIDAQEYKGIPIEVDLTPYDEYSTLQADVYAQPLNANMVTLYGKVINTKTGKPLEPGQIVKMRVNRRDALNFQYNEKNASYRLMLPVGTDYDVTPNVKNFYNRMEVVDLRNAKPRSKVPRDFFVMPLEVGQSVDIENIYFETGKSKLKPESYRSLNALVDFFNEYPNVKVLVGGHTDNTGSMAVNKRLSKARAQAVADYLIGQGIGSDRFQSEGYGPTKPKASNKTKQGRAMNRRVDFTIMGL